jgi:hypothetical protein
MEKSTHQLARKNDMLYCTGSCYAVTAATCHRILTAPGSRYHVYPWFAELFVEGQRREGLWTPGDESLASVDPVDLTRNGE